MKIIGVALGCGLSKFGQCIVWIIRDPFAGATAPASSIVRMVVADGMVAGAFLVLWFGFGARSHASITKLFGSFFT